MIKIIGEVVFNFLFLEKGTSPLLIELT